MTLARAAPTKQDFFSRSVFESRHVRSRFACQQKAGNSLEFQARTFGVGHAPFGATEPCPDKISLSNVLLLTCALQAVLST